MSEARLLELAGEAAMLAFGARLGAALPAGAVVHLHGPLGAGKTTLVRGLLRGLGHQGPVKSPTYTLVEPYEPDGRRVYHFDLYRLADAEELEYLGIRDYFDGHSLCLVEWPQRGAGVLPAADLEIFIDYAGADRRRLRLQAVGERGDDCLKNLSGTGAYRA